MKVFVCLNHLVESSLVSCIVPTDGGVFAAMDLPVAFGLPALPPELLLRVLRLLDVHSLVKLSAVSRHFNAAAADSTLWRHLYRRDFKGETITALRVKCGFEGPILTPGSVLWP